ncbi:hypothetical protein V6N13_024307 [Hibiscus sabdariffa]|uniref:Uncharacterized protein n=1 Tax=Hibiscus sabdariffa TaxID=183260 RepID=A0ABR2ASB9_9ROSI
MGTYDLYWRVPGTVLSRASVMPLRTDSDCMRLVNNLPRDRYIHVYLQEKRSIDDDEVEVEYEDEVEVEVEDEDEDELEVEVEDDDEVEVEVDECSN